MNKQQPTLLITGGAGFIGANFATYYLEQYPERQLIVLDKLTYAGTTEHLQEVMHLPNFLFVQGDVADTHVVHQLFQDYQITGIIHFAAESHVDRSIQDATSFVTTNVLGTHVLLHAAKTDWERKGTLKDNRFHHISTDEVYGSLDEDGMFSEETPYDPRNPYSASKAGANMLVRSFGYTYGMNIIISSCSNNYGPKQHQEKLIPTIIRHALHGERIPIYGDGQNIRDWIFVVDHCRALDQIYHHGKPMETYNVGGRNERTNIEMAEQICNLLDNKIPDHQKPEQLERFSELISFTRDRLGHDRRYAVDDRKIRRELGWEPNVSFQQGLQKTIDWYVDKWIPIQL
ncbi:dTDP-glucose 4,6-dehydratase [Ornithinibacillus gellani]|uniref:dTDP-glucose 4,6-dehydratase n=1 Tax=Ornithinibacillus gellani TaxID=2293253 RepID=UPI000F4ABE57|nr:dTDP-glucose 4,6-dehydratase [Ornithinibacillus gellani]TQS70585.1 dTDP-glucose 4,6-dehydratase [Ornithinibacillus gellani]